MFTFFTTLLAASVALAAPAPAERSLMKRGRVTFYTTKDSNPHFACGGWYTSDDMQIVALSTHGDFSMDKCGQQITVHYQGKTVTATIQDGCETCDPGEIDLSPGAMRVLDADYERTGQFDAQWSYGGGGGGGDNGGEQKDENKDKPKEPETTSSSETPSETPTPTPTPSPTPESTSTSTTETPSTTSSSTTTTTPSTSSTPITSTMTTSTMTATNATMSANATMSLNVTMSHNATATLNATAPIKSDSVIAGNGPRESGNLAGFGDVVVSLGRLVALAAGGGY